MSTPEPHAPGDVLRMWLAGEGWNQGVFAEIVGRNPQWISEVINGHKVITVESATQIAAALGNTPGYWLALQDRYRLWLLSQDAAHNRRLDEVRGRAAEARRKPR